MTTSTNNTTNAARPQLEPLLTIDDLVRLLRVDGRTIRRLWKRGQLPAAGRLRQKRATSVQHGQLQHKNRDVFQLQRIAVSRSTTGNSDDSTQPDSGIAKKKDDNT